LIDSKTNSFIRYIESLPPTSTPSTSDQPASEIPQPSKENPQIMILFYEKVTRRASWWATKTAESEVCWEKWELNFEFLPPARNERGMTLYEP
jgi:hypothetical protein